MIRIAAIACFLMTLFCPAFCLAGEEGECSDHRASEARNCEAMTVGAVVEARVVAAAPTFTWSSPSDALRPTAPLVAGPPSRSRLEAWRRANAKSPPAATRQALLQTFLF
jgi:hypothetical protein